MKENAEFMGVGKNTGQVLRHLWQLLILFNIDKCKVMHIGFNTNSCSNYDNDGIQIENVDAEKDLRIIISKCLKWEKQSTAAISTANKMTDQWHDQ